MKLILPMATLLAAALAGCAVMDTSGVTTATPAPFPYPGIYSGAVANGSLTYRINADGRGLSCFRNQLSGRMFFGDVRYDGARLHTEDGTLEVDSITPDELRLHALFVRANLRKVDEAPTVCKEFFKN
jgi:hypothetical protein